MSFIFKGMEKLMQWHLEETVLNTSPLHPQQHAFRRGYSTDTALTRAVSQIESCVLRGRVAISCFLDVNGAFSNVTPEAIEKALEKKNVPEDIRRWYMQFLRNRIVTCDYKGTTCTKHVMLGTPQGGVCSGIIWNIVFDGLLELFDDTSAQGTGFADDLKLTVQGSHECLQEMRNRLQRAVDKAIAWGKECGLTFNPKKTVVVVFHRKREIDLPP